MSGELHQADATERAYPVLVSRNLVCLSFCSWVPKMGRRYIKPEDVDFYGECLHMNRLPESSQ